MISIIWYMSIGLLSARLSSALLEIDLKAKVLGIPIRLKLGAESEEEEIGPNVPLWANPFGLQFPIGLAQPINQIAAKNGIPIGQLPTGLNPLAQPPVGFPNNLRVQNPPGLTQRQNLRSPVQLIPKGNGRGRSVGGRADLTKPSQITSASRRLSARQQQINNGGLIGNRGTGGGYGFGNQAGNRETFIDRYRGINQIPPGKNINRAIQAVQQMQQRTSARVNVPVIGPTVQLNNNNNRPVGRLPNITLGQSSTRTQVVPERRGNLARVVSGILLAEEKTARKVASPPTRKPASKAEGKPKAKNGRRQKTAPGANRHKQHQTKAQSAAPFN